MENEENLDLDKDKIYHYAYDISYPRRNGSEGNLKVRKDIIDYFSKMGYNDNEIIKEKFKWNEKIRKYYFRIFSNLMLICLLSLDVLIMLNMFSILIRFYYIIPSSILLGVMSYLYSRGHLISHKAYLNREQKFAENLKEAVNIYTKQPAKNKAKKLIIIGAHYDSINLKFGDKFNILLYLGKFLGIFLVGISGILFPIILYFLPFPLLILIFDILFWFFVFYTSFTQITWKFNSLHNESEGAIDNATGVSVVLASAEYFKKNPLENIDLIFVTFDVEEEGLIGSFDFAETHVDEFNTYGIENVKMICLDGPGSKGKLGFSGSFGFPLKTRTSTELMEDLDTQAKKLGYPTMKLWMPYGGSDHVPFAIKGIDTCHFFSTSVVSNTRADKKELINADNLVKCTKVIINYLTDLDQKIE